MGGTFHNQSTHLQHISIFLKMCTGALLFVVLSTHLQHISIFLKMCTGALLFVVLLPFTP